ncbi:MAG: ABC transporter ATP-binding protein [Treponema sp.]|nr:ABC transporter ATP-binding protein [Treponema sp.]
MTIIETKRLCKSFNLEAGFFARHDKTVYAVNDVSFAIERGSTYGLVGESGCGKTTTARLLVSMYAPTSGQVLYTSKVQQTDDARGVGASLSHDANFSGGENQTASGANSAMQNGGTQDIGTYSKNELRAYREKVKYIFQDPARSLNPRMSVYEVITAALRHSSKWNGTADAKERSAKIIAEVGLAESDLYRRPSEFSGGQRQRISLARALIMEPEALICDEIVSALDVSIQGQIINLLDDLRHMRDLSFLFITHDLKIACYFCDAIGVMYRGMLVEEAPAADLYKTAVHPYTKLLFDGARGKATASNAEVKTTLAVEKGCVFAHRCQYAQSQCTLNMPVFKHIGNGHNVRCVLAT